MLMYHNHKSKTSKISFFPLQLGNHIVIIFVNDKDPRGNKPIKYSQKS